MTELHGERVVLRRVTPDDVAELRRIRATPEVVRWWGELPGDFPEPDDPGDARFTVLVDGRVAGLVQYAEEQDPEARHADVDVFLDPELHGRGLGTDAMGTIVRHLVAERGHHRVTLSTSPDNAPALRCYEKVGFRPVGITRASLWHDVRGEWVDELLMDYVVPPGHPPEA
ncbi:MAG TPA: GNAT family protein [Actinomycetota bacterium]|nr:GNAT family protein [Actinomycetota bacterium]